MYERTVLETFALENRLYAGATVTAWTVDASGAKTSTKATLYTGITGSEEAANPQTLDSRGKWQYPVYAEEEVVLSISGLDLVADDDTGVIKPNLTAADADNADTAWQNSARLFGWLRHMSRRIAQISSSSIAFLGIGNGLTSSGGNIVVDNGDGLEFNSGAVQVKAGDGIEVDAGGVKVDANVMSDDETNQLTKALQTTVVTLTPAASVEIDFDEGNIFEITVDQNTTFTFANITPGHYELTVIQGGAGSFTLTFPAGVLFPGGTQPTESTAAGSEDIYMLMVRGTTAASVRIATAEQDYQ